MTRAPVDVPLDDIVVPDGRVRAPGDDFEAFARSVKNGLVYPIVLLPGNVLASGLRRLMAARHAGMDAIAAFHATDARDAAAIMLEQPQRDVWALPMTWPEVIAAGAVLEQYVPLPRYRGPGRRLDPEDRLERVDNVIGRALGAPSSGYRRVRYIARAATLPNLPPEVRAAAAEWFERISADMPGAAFGHINPGYEAVRALLRPNKHGRRILESLTPDSVAQPEAPPPPDPRTPGQIRRDQHDRLQRLGHTVTAMRMAADGILSEAVNLDPAGVRTAQQLTRDIENLRADLARIIRHLRGNS